MMSRNQTSIKQYLLPSASDSSTPVPLKRRYIPDESATDRALLDALTCCVCYEVACHSPILQCKNGHVTCRDCLQKLPVPDVAALAAAATGVEEQKTTKCPVCVVSLGLRLLIQPALVTFSDMARNRMAEAVIESSPRVVCSAACQQTIPTLLLTRHQCQPEFVAERGWKCILGGCSSPTEFKDQAGLMAHLETKHRARDFGSRDRGVFGVGSSA
jgi:hypothetical protein